MFNGVVGRCSLVALVVTLAAVISQAEDYPSRTIRMIVGTAPGGSIDVEGRILAQKMAPVLGQQIVVENRPGASGLIAAELVANAAPDGYTTFFHSGDIFTLPSLSPNPSFDPDKALLPVAMVSSNPLVIIAGAGAAFNSVQELIAAAHARATPFTYGTYGVATYNNVIGQWFASKAHIKLTNVVYHSGADAALAAVAGEIDLAVVSPASVYPSLVDAGKVKIIALTGGMRPSYLPASWPTLNDAGLSVDGTVFAGLFAPKDTPANIAAALDHAVDQSLQDDSVRQLMINIGFNPQHMGPLQFAGRIKTDRANYEAVIREAKIEIEK